MALSDFNLRIPGIWTVLDKSLANQGTGEIDMAGAPGIGPTGPTGPTGPAGSGNTAILVEGGSATTIGAMTPVSVPPPAMPYVALAVAGDTSKDYKSPLNSLLVMPNAASPPNLGVVAGSSTGNNSGGSVIIGAGNSAVSGNGSGGDVVLSPGLGWGTGDNGDLLLTLDTAPDTGSNSQFKIQTSTGEQGLPSSDPNISQAIWSDNGTLVYSGFTAASGGGAGATFIEATNQIVAGSEFSGLTTGNITTINLYTPEMGDESTIEVLGIFLSVTTDYGQKYNATLASIDQTNEVVSTYQTTTNAIQAPYAQVPLTGQILQSNGQGQIVAIQIENLVTSPFTCDILLVYELSAPLDVPTLGTFTEPSLYTGSRLATIHVNPTDPNFPETRWIFANQVTFWVIANEHDTTMTILNSSNVAENLPSAWKSGMVLVANTPTIAPEDATYVTAGGDNPYATQIIPPWPPGTTGTTLTAGSITLSNAMTADYSGEVTAYWVALQDGGTIIFDAGTHYMPGVAGLPNSNIPAVFGTPITISGIKTDGVLTSVLDGRGGIGSGPGFRLTLGKGTLHVSTPCTIENLAFVNGGGADGDGDGEAAVYVEGLWGGGTVNINNCSFDNNENGVFAPQNALITINLNNCDFGFIQPNGASHDGQSHDNYINVQNLNVSNCFYYGSLSNCIKSRSPNLTISNTYINHLQDRTIDFPEGGTLVVSDSILTSQFRSYGDGVGTIQVVANYLGFKDEPDTVTINPDNIDIDVTNSWITTNRFQDGWWISPPINCNLTNCMVQYVNSQGETAPLFVMSGNSPNDGTVVWTYDGVVQSNPFPTGSFGDPIPLINPVVRAFNITAISTCFLDNNTVLSTVSAGTIVGNFLLNPTVSSVGVSGSSTAVLLTNPNFNTNTASFGYFQIVSAATDSGIALATNQDHVPQGTYSLSFLIMAPYSGPQVFTISIISEISLFSGAITESGTAADTINEHASTFRPAISESGTANDTVASAHVTLAAIAETGTAAASDDATVITPLMVATQPATAETGSSISGTLAFASSPTTSITGTWNNSGGSATISNAVIVGNFVTFDATTPSGANTYALTLTASGNSAISQNIVVSTKTSDGFSTGITGPSDIMLGQDAFNHVFPIGSYLVRGNVQPVTWSITGTDESLFFISPNGVLSCSQINTGGTTRSINVKATDTVTIWTQAVTIHNPVTGTPTVVISANVVLDSAPTNGFVTGTGVVVANVGLWNCSTLTFSDPSGLFTWQPGSPNWITLQTSSLTTYGTYPITITPAGGSSFVYDFYIAHEAAPLIGWTPTGTLYTTTPVTNGYGSNLIGTLTATADSGVLSTNYSSNPSGALDTYSTDPFFDRTGLTYLLDTVSGTVTGTCEVTSVFGKSRNLLFNLPIAVGTQYPSSSISGTPVSGLTNYLPTANILTPTGSPTTVLTITVSGFSPVWADTILDVLNDNCQLTANTVGETFVPRYAISGSGSSATITAWNLSAVNETTPQVDQLQITLTDGTGGYCTKVFDISTSWHPYTGAALTVGSGGTWADPLTAGEAIWGDPDTYAGATITLLRGCPNTWSYAQIFTSGGWMPCPIHWCGDKSTQASFTGSISNGSGGAGTILNTSISSGLFAGDWIATGAATGTLLLSAIDSTHWNVSVSQLVAGGTAMTTQIPQIPFNFSGLEGDNQNKGALHCAGGYDTIWERVEVYNARNGGGFSVQGNCGAFYRENHQPGNCTLLNCYAHNSDNGWINGDYGNHIYLIDCLFAACGGSGLNHNIYCGEAASFNVSGTYSIDSLGHELKIRAYSSTITDSFFLEGLNWWGNDSTAENAEGGLMTFNNNVAMKGCDGSRDGENGNTFEWANETQNSTLPSFYTWYPCILSADSNTIIDTATSFGFPTTGWNVLGGNSDPIREIPYTTTITNSLFYNLPEDHWSVGSFGATAMPLDGSGNVATTTLPPGIQIINPVTGGKPFLLPYAVLNVGSAPGHYDMMMTIPATQSSGNIPGGLLAAYDDEGNQLTSVSASISGGDTTGFSITASGNTAQLTVTASHTAGVYYPQITITGTSAGTAPGAKYFAVFVLPVAPITAAITESGTAVDTDNGSITILVSAAISESGTATDSNDATIVALPALIAHAFFSTGNAGGTSTGIDTTGASLIVVDVTSANVGGGPTLADIDAAFSDSYGNTWTSYIPGGVPGGQGNILIYCISPTVGTGHTFTCDVSALYGGFIVAAFSQVISFDQSDIGYASSVTTISCTTGVTPANDGSLLIASGSFNDSSLPTIDSGYTIADGFVTGTALGGAIAYLVQGSAALSNPNWSWTNSENGSAVLASFNTGSGSLVAADGSPSGVSGAAQYPTLLDSYTARAPWNVAGVDYPVGPTSTPSLDPTTSPPSGTSYDSGLHLLEVTSDNVVIDGYDFSVDGGVSIYCGSNNNLTITNCNFGGANYDSLSTGIIDMRGTGLTVSHCEIDGHGDTGSIQSWVIGAQDGTVLLQYNWIKNYPNQILSIDTPGCTLMYRWNLIDQCVLETSGHQNILQSVFSGGDLQPTVIYNTLRQTITASGEGVQLYNNGSSNTVTNPVCSNNTFVVTGTSGNMSYIIHGPGGTPVTPVVGTGLINNNYFDTTGAFGPFYGGSFTDCTGTGNIDMTTGGTLTL